MWAPATRRMSARPMSTGARAPAPRKHTLESVLSAGLARLELERGVRATAAGEGGGEKQSGKEAVAPFYSEEEPGVEPPLERKDPGKDHRVKGKLYDRKGGPQMWDGFRFLCKHERQPSKCKECGGSGLCEHGKRRSRCKECGGGEICEHGRERSQCKECGGGGICEHGKNRSQCKECGGGAICEHGKRRSRCKTCGGSELCEHGRRRSQCKECGGASICEHGRRRSQCKECGGGEICEHGKRRSTCKTCGKKKVPSTNDTAPAPAPAPASQEIACRILEDSFSDEEEWQGEDVVEVECEAVEEGEEDEWDEEVF